jgi:tetratricopeptide (TPR) repeat protein
MERAFVRAGLLTIFGLFLAGTGLRAQEKDDAIREKALALNKITGTKAMDGRLRELVKKDVDETKKLLTIAVKMSKEKPQPFNYNAMIILAKVAHNLKQNEQAEAFYKIGVDEALKVQSANKITQMYDGLIDLYFETKNYDDAIKKCKEFLEIKSERGGDLDKLRPFIMERLIQATARKGLIDEAMRLAENLVELEGDEGWYFLRLKGEVQREAGKYEDAAKTFQEAIKRVGKNEDLDKMQRERYLKSLRYSLSGLYIDANDVDKAAEQMKALLKDDPDNPVFLNDLGFIWADHDKNIDESEKMIRKAIEEERKKRKAREDLEKEDDHDNAAYLDSLGWVLYKKKQYAEAKKELLEAIKYEEGKHIEIYDHLAEVHMALGETAAAVKAWEVALKLDNISKRDKERREAIEKKLKKAQEKK